MAQNIPASIVNFNNQYIQQLIVPCGNTLDDPDTRTIIPNIAALGYDLGIPSTLWVGDGNNWNRLVGNTGMGSIGPTGNTGQPGVASNTGSTGQIGLTGSTGLGLIGNTGSTGNIGQTGSTGQMGNTGQPGLASSTGSTGQIGLMGSTGLGVIGNTGNTGNTGQIGLMGSTGLGIMGNTGSTGQTGHIGSTGQIGNMGPTGSSSSSSLTNTFIGYGSGLNTITGTSNLTFNNSTSTVTIGTGGSLGNIIMNNSIASYSPSNLNYYENFDTAITLQVFPNGNASSFGLSFTRIGNIVYMSYQEIALFFGGVPSYIYSSNGSGSSAFIPARFAPLESKSLTVPTVDGTTTLSSGTGLFEIQSNGLITVNAFNNTNFSSTYGGLVQGVVSWIISTN